MPRASKSSPASRSTGSAAAPSSSSSPQSRPSPSSPSGQPGGSAAPQHQHQSQSMTTTTGATSYDDTASGTASGEAPASATASSSAAMGNPANAGPSGTAGAADPPPKRKRFFYSQRVSRACQTCHNRKVRCDAAVRGIPCTNCAAFNIECIIPGSKARAGPSAGSGESSEAATQQGETTQSDQTNVPSQAPLEGTIDPWALGSRNPGETSGPSAPYLPDIHYDQIMEPGFEAPQVREAGRLAFLGDSWDLFRISKEGLNVVHYPLPDLSSTDRSKADELDELEVNILNQRGAFLLPPKVIRDDLVDTYFSWVAPILPIINRYEFMKRYRDTRNTPSLLLLQAIFAAASRVSSNPKLVDDDGSTIPASKTFYLRARALYDANYEPDRVTVIQSALILGWCWENPTDITSNGFYWTHLAITIAQGLGMHRSIEGSQVRKPEKRLWKRVWWTLFTRDRAVAAALGRPVMINLSDSDVEMLDEDDFIENEAESANMPEQDALRSEFFLQYVELCKIIDLVVSQERVPHSGSRGNALHLTEVALMLGDWYANCPDELRWSKKNHHFLSALLAINHYTAACLVHLNSRPQVGHFEPGDASSIPAIKAADTIIGVVESLIDQGHIRRMPAFTIYSIATVTFINLSRIRSSSDQAKETATANTLSCLNALKQLGKVWSVADVVLSIFSPMLSTGDQQDPNANEAAAGLGQFLSMQSQDRARGAQGQSLPRQDESQGYETFMDPRVAQYNPQGQPSAAAAAAAMHSLAGIGPSSMGGATQPHFTQFPSAQNLAAALSLTGPAQPAWATGHQSSQRPGTGQAAATFAPQEGDVGRFQQLSLMPEQHFGWYVIDEEAQSGQQQQQQPPQPQQQQPQQ